MNHAEIKANAEVMLAFTNGKAIQNRLKGSLEWNDVHPKAVPDFTFKDFEYRIKPMPEQFFITVYGDDACAALTYDAGVGGTYITAAAARQGGTGGHRIFKVVEVTE